MTDPLAGLPDAALVPVGWMREKLAEEEPSEPAPSVVQPSETTWRQKLWTAPAECRLEIVNK